ncbi:hypothetical protein H9L39_07932 [Fusarium oxysporum f. sp. albedinis]|nr:hypothetical protein H9L39_07932 [Fusarium oxysporum f. sp. albedinis]
MSIDDCESKRFTLLTPCELLLPFSALALFLVVALEALIVLDEYGILVENVVEGVVISELGKRVSCSVDCLIRKHFRRMATTCSAFPTQVKCGVYF